MRTLHTHAETESWAVDNGLLLAVLLGLLVMIGAAYGLADSFDSLPDNTKPEMIGR